MKRNAPLINFIKGEWSPQTAGLVDDPDYNKSLSWCQNFIVTQTGALQFRPGNNLAGLTNENSNAYLIPFQFSSNDAMVVEATNNLFRFYRNGALVLNANVAITGISQANPAVVTAPNHGLNTGQQVFITGVWGMQQVNNRYFTVGTTTTNTFQLYDQFGNAVNSTTYTAFQSAGTPVVASVYSVGTPYTISDIPLLRWGQDGDVMYIVHPNYAPYKLTRLGFTNWTLSTFSRTNDPFTTGGVTSPVSNIVYSSGSNYGALVVTVASTTNMNVGDWIQLSGVVGSMSAFNNPDTSFIVSSLTSTTLTCDTMVVVSGNTATYSSPTSGKTYTSGGTVTDNSNYPQCFCFTPDGRALYGATRAAPTALIGSELGSGTTSNFDNFNTGTPENDAYAFALVPVSNSLDSIQEITAFGSMIAVLTASSVSIVYGNGTGSPPNPDAIGTIPTIQGSARIMPIPINWTLLFVDVNEKRLLGLQFNFYYSSFEAVDYSYKQQHFGDEAPFIKIVKQKGVPQIVWVLRADGVLLSFTFDNINQVGAWARHTIAGGGQVIDICSIRNSDGDDQLYMTVQRTINGQIRNTVEVLSQWPDVPLQRAFYTGNQTNDFNNYAYAAWESLKYESYLDGALTYDGTARGTAAGANLTFSAATGTGVTVIASEPVFQSNDVDNQLWQFYNSNGSGGGQSTIKTFISSTEVTVDITVPFGGTTANAGNWAFATNTVVNLQLYAGQTLAVQADGGAHPNVTVSANGTAVLQRPCSVAIFGFAYVGLAATQNLDFGTQFGSGGSKPRSVPRIRGRVDRSIGLQLGTSEYETMPALPDTAAPLANMPPVPYSGSFDVLVFDDWEQGTKQAVLLKTDPTPCTFLGFDVEMETNEPS